MGVSEDGVFPKFVITSARYISPASLSWIDDDMETTAAKLLKAWPYQKDKMNLPVKEVDSAVPFYEALGFRVHSKRDQPVRLVILGRDEVEIGLAENGGDPTQDGCFFEVDDVNRASAELRARGLTKEISPLKQEKHGDTEWTVFYLVAPDGLCYCFGQRVGK